MTWEELQRELERTERGWWRRLLPRSLYAHLFGTPEVRRERFERARLQVKARYDELNTRVDPQLERVASKLNSTIVTDQQLESQSRYEPELEQIREAIASFHTALDEMDDLPVDRQPGDFLYSEEWDTVEDWKHRLDRLEATLDTKRTLDTRWPTIERHLESLQERMEPYDTYERYLTQAEQDELSRRQHTLQKAVDDLQRDIDCDLVTVTDRQRMTGVQTALDAIDAQRQNYNAEFVSQRCEAYDDLFSDIDGTGTDLNHAQRVAVVTNDIRNLVVAAAGTGKTLALTYRIAYLVEEGIDPSRITALTYTRQAAREMETRLAEQFGIESVDVRTIHSLAYEIAQETAEGRLDVADSQDLYNLVDDVIREAKAGQRADFLEFYTQFLFHYDHTHLDEADFDSRSGYIAKRRQESYETLAGETVASRAERVIADFLFTHDVDYQYEAVATWAESATDRREYRPDFSLPEYDLYIEHWGLDERAEVAPWFSQSSEEYREKLHWARDQFAESDYSLVETYEFEYEAGWLEDALRYRLEHAGVELRRLDFEEFVDTTFEYNEKERDIRESFVSFVHNAKTFGIGADEARTRLSRTRPRQYYFGQCATIVLDVYNEYLRCAGLVDFDDMINEATAAIQTNPERYRSQYDHLLVDEFQDVSMHQLDLIRTLTDGQSGPRLFCVGDDWQSIYSFQGADVEQFIEFEKHFGPAAETQLTKNYRCPKTVLEAGNALIASNDRQIEKQVEPAAGHDCQPRLHVLDGYTESAYVRRVGTYATTLVEAFLANGNDPGDVMVLCRYDEGASFTDRVKRALERRDLPWDGKQSHYRPDGYPDEYQPEFDPDAGVAVYSVHQAKGRQAKQVIVLNVVSGMYGFPAEHRENSLVAPVQDIEVQTIEEERRLFYVAVTRAREELHVLTRAGSWSPFVHEIEPFLTVERSIAWVESEGCEDEGVSLTAKVRQLWDDLHETQHQAGVLEDQTGTVRFVSWTSESPPTVDEGVWYHFEDVDVGEFNGETQLTIRAETAVTPLYEITSGS